MAELIQKQDTLNEGRIKLNAAITDAEQAKVTADGADSKATQALAISENTQTQLDTIVINGDSSVEAAQARVDEKGVGHTTLKDRIDDGFTKVTSQLNETNSQLAQTAKQKADKTEVQSNLNLKRDKSVPIGLNDVGADILQALSESPGVPFNLLSIPRQKSVTSEQTTFATTKWGKNLFNKADIIEDTLYSAFPNTGEVTGYFTTGNLIPLKANATYTINHCRYWGLMDITGTVVNYENTGNNGATVTITTEDVPMLLGISGSMANLDATQIEEGSVATAYTAYIPPKIYIDDLSFTDEQTDQLSDKVTGLQADQTEFAQIAEGKNSFNKDNVTPDTFLHQNTGRLDPLSGYSTSDYILLMAGQPYTLNTVRVYAFFTLDREHISGVNTGNNNATITVTPDQNCLLRASIDSSNLDSFQIEKGTVVTEYEPYIKSTLIPNLAFTDEQRNALLSGFDAFNSYDVKVTKSGEIYQITSGFNESQEITIKTERNGSENGGFNFIETSIGNTVIHSNRDDIAPVRISGATVGANHGYTFIQEITMTNHGKTIADLGSQWTDGTTTFTLLKVEGDVLTFGSPYTVGTQGEVSSSRVTPVADLTHVTGATNTGLVSISNIYSSGQLYPSTNNHTVKYILDGKEITKDGVYGGEELQVHENYNIMDYKAIIDFAQTNVGTSYANDDVGGALNLNIIYTFTKGGKCLISHSFKALKTVQVANCGFLQSVALRAPEYTTKRYLPHINPIGGYDFKNIVDITDYNVNLLVNDGDLIDPAKPPNRYVDWLYDLSNNKRYGFTMGYIIDKTDSKNASRLANTSTYWDLRSTKKSYPVAMGDEILPAGTYRTFLGYRNYLSAEDAGEMTNFNVVEDKKETYVYIDSHLSTTAYSKELKDNVGKNIEIVSSEGFQLLNDVIDGGITYNITSVYGYAILKIV